METDDPIEVVDIYTPLEMYPVIIICEGQCNPRLREYDEALKRATQERFQVGGVNRRTMELIQTWSRGLVHRLHTTKEQYYRFKNGSWTRIWQCSVCGHRRTF